MRPPIPRKIGAMADSPGEEDWYLQAWMAHFGKRQADLAKALGWSKNRAHFVWHSSQPYRRPEVNLIARWLGIKPFELLMPPKDALALRALRHTAAQIVAETPAPLYEVGPPANSTPGRQKTGTAG